jgi:hypothetical protein
VGEGDPGGQHQSGVDRYPAFHNLTYRNRALTLAPMGQAHCETAASLMSEMGLGRAKTFWETHRRVVTWRGGDAGHFPDLAAFRLSVLLMRIPAVLGSSSTVDSRMSAATMPSLPRRAVRRP